MKNPPAFPIQGFSTRYGQGFQAVMSDGMTLRDYFAARAMESFISGWTARNIYPPNDLVVAEHAYTMADAMLKARES